MNLFFKRLTAMGLIALMNVSTVAEPVLATETDSQQETDIEETFSNITDETRETVIEETLNPQTVSETETIQEETQSTPKAAEYNKVTVTPDAAGRYYTICVSNLSEEVSGVYIPVWSEKNGQDDIRWYTAKKSGTEWTCTVDVKNHKSDSGNYIVHVYGDTAATKNKLLTNSTFSVTGVTGGKLVCTSSDTSKGLYMLELTGMSSPAGIAKVEIPVWSEKNGQDDICWYTAVSGNGKWYVEVDISKHKYDSGTYNAHAYIYDNRGMKSVVGTKFNVTAMKTNQMSVELNGDQSKATVTLKNVSMPAGTETIYFPTWGNAGGQNDVQWYKASKVDSHTYRAVVPISNHKETGKYSVHAYASGKDKNIFLTNETFVVEGMTAKAIISDKDDVNGFFTVEITDLYAPAAIVSMQIPIWSQKNGQDDINWYTAEKKGNRWFVKVDIGDHKVDTGVYNIHVYATDSRGISGLIANTTTNVKKPTAVAAVKANVLPDNANVELTISNVAGASQVTVPVWGETGGQNDIVWYPAKKVNSRTWQVTVPLVNHMEKGVYQAHAYTSAGGKMQLLATTNFKIEKIVVNALNISNQNNERGTFTVNVINPTGISNINSVRVAVWSMIDGQDDLLWYEAKYANGMWSVNVDAADHQIDTGVYMAHAYAYNAAGQSVCVGGVTANVVITGKLGFQKEGNKVYYYSSYGKKAYGHQRIKGSRYYFDTSTGAMAVGWQYIDGYKYYFDGNGKMMQDIDSLIGMQSSYILKINKQANTVTMYAYDAATRSYCIPVKAMRCSTGDPTPLGTYPLRQTYRWMLMYNGTYCQFLSLITGNFLIHSITYETMNNRTLQTIGYNRLGINKSAGCVRLRCGDAYWVYNLVNSGRLRQVTIYNSSTPGPFDQPYYAPIPENQRWDPTDPTL